MVKKAQSVIAGLFLVVAMLFGCWVLTGGTLARAAKAPKYIKIGLVNPTTGIVAVFGQGSPLVEEHAIAAVNKEGGIYIAKYHKKIPIKLITIDSESSPTKAAEAATKLILQDKVNLLLAHHTPLVVNPVSAVAERYHMPCVVDDDPIQMWTVGGHHHWTFNSSFSVPVMAQVYVNIWNRMHTNKIVGFLHDNMDGAVVEPYVRKAALAGGYKIVNPGLVPVGTKDFSSVIAKFKEAHCDIIVGNMNPPDFATAWKQFHQAGYVPKIMTMGKAILFPSAVEALGDDLGVGLTDETWWTVNYPFKSSLDGTTAKQLGQWWIKETGKEPSAKVGFKYGIIEIAVNALRRAKSLNREKIREALATTDLNTIIGHIKYNKDNWCATPLTGGQWVKGTRWHYVKNIITNKLAPEIPLSKAPMIPIPGSK